MRAIQKEMHNLKKNLIPPIVILYWIEQWGWNGSEYIIGRTKKYELVEEFRTRHSEVLEEGLINKIYWEDLKYIYQTNWSDRNREREYDAGFINRPVVPQMLKDEFIIQNSK